MHRHVSIVHRNLPKANAAKSGPHNPPIAEKSVSIARDAENVTSEESKEAAIASVAESMMNLAHLALQTITK
jgi:hypothetical protein